MARDTLEIKRQGDHKFKITKPDGTHDNLEARYFRIFNGDVTFYDKMDRSVAEYSSDAEIEVK